jgi:hypothetical protein
MINPSDWAIAATLHTLCAANSYLKIHTGVPWGEDWFTSQDLLAPTGNLLDDLLTTILTTHQSTDKRFGAMSFVNGYWLMTAVAFGSYYLAKRVPCLDHTNIAFHMNRVDGHIDEIAVLSERFYCLPEDPAATDPQAVVLPDDDALGRTLRESLEAHLTPVVNLLRTRSPIGTRALWAAAADNCAYVIIMATTLLQQAERCDDEITRLIQVMGSPLKGKSGALWVEHEGQCQPFLKRGSCCLSYTLPAGYGYCATCPLLKEAERVERLKAYVSTST